MQIVTKKRVWVFVSILLGINMYLPVLAVAEAPTNTVQMVTYFPVPYVQYTNLYPKKLDIGLTSNTFTLEVGSFLADTVLLSDSPSSSLGPTLQMALNFTTDTATFGQTSAGASATTVEFYDLFVNAIKKGEENVSFNLKGMDPNNEIKFSAFTVGGHELPGCNGIAKWRQKIDDEEHKKCYLVCCEGTACNNTDGWTECK